MSSNGWTGGRRSVLGIFLLIFYPVYIAFTCSSSPVLTPYVVIFKRVQILHKLVTSLFCLLQQSTSVLSLSELSKTPLQNGLSTPPLPSSEASSTRLSPPNVSALLDISLPGPPEDVLSQGEPATQISDSIIEIAISSGQYSKSNSS